MCRWKFLFLGLFVLALSGCSAVYVGKPVGEKTHPVLAEDWEGTWITNDGSVSIQVVDGPSGKLNVFWAEWKQGAAVCETHDFLLRESGDWIFASVKDEEAKAPRYFWARIDNKENQITVWLPDPDKFKTAVRSEKLPGTLEGDDVQLGDLAPEQMKWLRSQAQGSLLDWDHPKVFIRLVK